MQVESESEAAIRLRQSRKLGLCQKLSNEFKQCYLNGATPDQRAKELDGGYFEKLTSLDWRNTIKKSSNQHIKQIEDLPEPKNLDDIPEGAGDDEEVVCEKQTSSLSDKQREALYCESIYTIMHQIGSPEKQVSNGDLYVYLQEVLNISNDKHRELHDKTKLRQSPEVYLKVQVVEARNLEAKDANGLSDPYCMIGLITNTAEVHQEPRPKLKLKRKTSKTLQEILKTESIKMTTVRENTVNPTWNETFTFEVNDVVNEVLHIDIWDCDDKEKLIDQDNKITKIKGFHGVGRYLKDAVQSARAGANDSTDDFLGFLEFSLKNVPPDGINEWFTLKTKSSKCRVSGDCHVKISLSAGKIENV